MLFTKPIADFPNYFVRNDGIIINVNTGREMTLSPTENGDLTVGLMRGGHQYRRSVKVLVAEAFVPGESDINNTPILLNGDKTDLRAENIAWRPRWLAWKYSIQFQYPNPTWIDYPVRDVTTGVDYQNIVHAAMENGILCADIVTTIIDPSRRVYPTGGKFVWI